MVKTKTGRFSLEFFSDHKKDVGSLRLKLAERGFGVPQNDCDDDWDVLEYRVGNVKATLSGNRATMVCDQDLCNEEKRFMRAVHSEYWWNDRTAVHYFVLETLCDLIGGIMAATYITL